jgi:hypothetical protein
MIRLWGWVVRLRPARLSIGSSGSRRSCGASRNYRGNGFARGDGLSCCNHGWFAVIGGCELLAILCGRLLVLDLSGHGRNALFARGGDFGGQRLASDAARSVVTDACVCDVDGSVVHDNRIRHRAVVNLDVGDVGYVVDGAVVVETIAVPVAALVANADVAKTVVNAAVVADVPAPISVVVAVSATGVAPISGSPKIAGLGRTRPRAGHPIVALRRIAPISGRPEIAVAGAVGLRVFGERRRGVGRFYCRLAVGRVLVVIIIVRIVIGIASVTIVVIAITVVAVVVAIPPAFPRSGLLAGCRGWRRSCSSLSVANGG